MGLPSTTAEAQRMQSINPDNFVQYPTRCTGSISANSASLMIPMLLPQQLPPQSSNHDRPYTQHYSTNSYCMGYIYSRSVRARRTMLNFLLRVLPALTAKAGSWLAGGDAYQSDYAPAGPEQLTYWPEFADCWQLQQPAVQPDGGYGIPPHRRDRCSERCASTPSLACRHSVAPASQRYRSANPSPTAPGSASTRSLRNSMPIFH